MHRETAGRVPAAPWKWPHVTVSEREKLGRTVPMVRVVEIDKERNVDPKTVELNNNDDSDSQQAAVVFTPWKEDQKINRIAMEFKVSMDRRREDESFQFKGTYEGVIMYGSLEGGGDLKMYAVGNLGTLVVSDTKPMNFTLGPHNKWGLLSSQMKKTISSFHYVGILVGNDKLDLSVDGVGQTIPLAAPLLFTSLIFGSSPPNDGVAELGLTACLRNVYVDHLDLLELQANKDTRVTALGANL